MLHCSLSHTHIHPYKLSSVIISFLPSCSYLTLLPSPHIDIHTYPTILYYTYSLTIDHVLSAESTRALQKYPPKYVLCTKYTKVTLYLRHRAQFVLTRHTQTPTPRSLSPCLTSNLGTQQSQSLPLDLSPAPSTAPSPPSIHTHPPTRCDYLAPPPATSLQTPTFHRRRVSTPSDTRAPAALPRFFSARVGLGTLVGTILFLVFSHPLLPKVWPNFNLNPPSNLVAVKSNKIECSLSSSSIPRQTIQQQQQQQHQQTTDLAQLPQPFPTRSVYRTERYLVCLDVSNQPQRRVVGSSRCRRRVIVCSSRCKSTKIQIGRAHV